MWRACASSKLKRRPNASAARGPTGGRGRRRFGGAAGEIDEDPVPEPGVDRHDRLEPEVAHRPFEDHGARDDDLRAARLEPCAPLGDRLPGELLDGAAHAPERHPPRVAVRRDDRVDRPGGSDGPAAMRQAPGDRVAERLLGEAAHHREPLWRHLPADPKISVSRTAPSPTL